MQTMIEVEETQMTVPELLKHLTPGDEVILTRNHQRVAKIIGEQPQPVRQQRPGPGLCKGMITYIAPDFDAPLDDMKEYME